jgi:alpha-1,6-mannosyltransferase
LVPYLVLAGALLVLMVVQTLNRQWSSDYWVHQATVETFRHDLASPVNELTHSSDPSPSYTPYMLGLAVVARVTGWASVTVLQWAAIANLVAFLVGFHLFVTALTRRRLASFFALAATLVCWGIDPWRWSGFLNLNSIGFGLNFPSMFATALALFVGWAFLRYDDTGGRAWLVLIGGGLATILLSHPFTGLWTGVMLLAIGIHHRTYRRERVVPLAITGVMVVLLLAVWPYYSFFELLRVGDAYTQAALYRKVPLRMFAALPGFYIVFRRFLRDRTDPLALMMIGGLVLYGYGWVSDSTNYGRAFPLVMLAAHIAIGVLLADVFERHARPSGALLGWIVVSAAIGLVGVAPGVVRMIPRAVLPESRRNEAQLRPITERFDALSGALPSGSVIIAESFQLGEVAPAYGLGVVHPSRPTPFVDDLARRARDSNAFLRSSAPETRQEIARRYGIDGVLCATRQCVDAFASSQPTHEIVAKGPGWTLVAVPRQ